MPLAWLGQRANNEIKKDRWDVELGKVLAKAIEPRLSSGDAAGLDASTAGLLKMLRD